MNTLYVAHAQLRHSGDYSCAASNSRQFHRVQVSASMAEGSDARLNKEQSCYHLVPNKSLALSCELSEAGRPVSWYKDEELLARPRERYLIEPGRLIITGAETGDAGTYSCLGGRGAGFSVNVAAPIVIEPLPEYREARMHATVDLECKVITRPQPKVTWYRGDASLVPSDKLSLVPGKDGIPDAMLIIRDVSVRDKGRYTCRATHAHCSDPMHVEASTELLVRVFTLNPNPASGKALAKPGEPLVISCDPLDKTKKITWMKGTTDIPSDDAKLSVVENGTSILTISKPTEEDAASYSCNDGTDTKTIEVFYKVTVTTDETHTTASSALVEGKEVWIALKVTGVPAPTLAWTKDGAAWTMPSHVTAEEHNKIPNAMLHFKPIKVEDEGTYTCNATGAGMGTPNPPDVDTFEYKLKVKGKYAALVPFLAICAEVVILCAVIYFVEKKALKAEEPAPPTVAVVDAPEGDDAAAALPVDVVVSAEAVADVGQNLEAPAEN
ncbi:hypothetical protein ISCGN_027578 [Ixodes scapularis]